MDSSVAKTIVPGASWDSEELLTPLNGIVFLVCWALPIVSYGWYRHRRIKLRERAAPLVVFLTELTSGASAGHDRKLLSMFHPAIFRRVERGTLRAMCRCVVDQYGPFVSVDSSSLDVRQRGQTTSVVAKVNFTKALSVSCQAAWVTNEATKVWQIIGFNVLPIHEGDFDVLSYVRPEDFTSFGERFVCALFARTPISAVEMMYPTLQAKYKDEESLGRLAGEVAKVLRACGGLRNKSEVDLTMVDGRVVRSGDSEGSRNSGIELEFAVLGAVRDIKVSFKLVFSDLRCTVIKYHLAAQPVPHTQQRHVLLDQDTGETTTL